MILAFWWSCHNRMSMFNQHLSISSKHARQSSSVLRLIRLFEHSAVGSMILNRTMASKYKFIFQIWAVTIPIVVPIRLKWRLVHPFTGRPLPNWRFSRFSKPLSGKITMSSSFILWKIQESYTNNVSIKFYIYVFEKSIFKKMYKLSAKKSKFSQFWSAIVNRICSALGLSEIWAERSIWS